MRPAIKKLSKLAPLLVGVTLIVGMLISFSLNRTIIHNELVALDLIPRPDRLTELYFNNNQNLPSSMTNNQEINFAFVVHNLETIDYHYDYQVSMRTNGTRHIIENGIIFVKQNQYFVKHENFKFTGTLERQEIIVSLLNTGQSIDFWIYKHSGSA